MVDRGPVTVRRQSYRAAMSTLTVKLQFVFVTLNSVVSMRCCVGFNVFEDDSVMNSCQYCDCLNSNSVVNS